MLYKLEYYGVKGPALQLLRSYLSDRKQYVEFENVKSDSSNIKTGVPQGSILGPLLFGIYVNDISLASKIFTAIIYADDTSISNQFILTGVFPDKLKIAKVIPIHKKDDKSQLENYRTISILSQRLLKGLFFIKCMIFFTPTNEGQYGFNELDKGNTHLIFF